MVLAREAAGRTLRPVQHSLPATNMATDTANVMATNSAAAISSAPQAGAGQQENSTSDCLITIVENMSWGSADACKQPTAELRSQPHVAAYSQLKNTDPYSSNGTAGMPLDAPLEACSLIAPKCPGTGDGAASVAMHMLPLPLAPLPPPPQGDASRGASHPTSQLSVSEVGASLHWLLTPVPLAHASAAAAAAAVATSAGSASSTPCAAGVGTPAGGNGGSSGAASAATSASGTPSAGGASGNVPSVLCCKRTAHGLVSGGPGLERISLERSRCGIQAPPNSRGSSSIDRTPRSTATSFDRPRNGGMHHSASNSSLDRPRTSFNGGSSYARDSLDRSRSSNMEAHRSKPGGGRGNRVPSGRGGRGAPGGSGYHDTRGGSGRFGVRGGGGGFMSRASSPALSSCVREDTEPGCLPPGISRAASMLVPSLSGAAAPGAAITDLQRLLSQVTPMLPLDASKQTLQALEQLTLSDVWQFYHQPSMFAREVPTLCGHRGPSTCYYVPYLSAMQLFTPVPSKSAAAPGTYVCGVDSWPHHMHLAFEYFESEMPFNRMPMYEHIETLAEQQQQQQDAAHKAHMCTGGAGADVERTGQHQLNGECDGGGSADGGSEDSEDGAHAGSTGTASTSCTDASTSGCEGTEPGSPLSPLPSVMPAVQLRPPARLALCNAHLRDLHPASWYAVAWYPVYRIPDAPLCARFLTYHSFAPPMVAASALTGLRPVDENAVPTAEARPACVCAQTADEPAADARPMGTDAPTACPEAAGTKPIAAGASAVDPPAAGLEAVGMLPSALGAAPAAGTKPTGSGASDDGAEPRPAENTAATDTEPQRTQSRSGHRAAADTEPRPAACACVLPCAEEHTSDAGSVPAAKPRLGHDQEHVSSGGAGSGECGSGMCEPMSNMVVPGCLPVAASAGAPLGSAHAAPLHVVGLKWCNMQGERWHDVPTADDGTAAPTPLPGGKRSQLYGHLGSAWHAQMDDLQRTAEWLSRGSGLQVLSKKGAQSVRIRHPDFEFFSSRS